MHRAIFGWIIGILVFAGCTWFVYWAATVPTDNTGKEPIPVVTTDDWMRGTLADNKVQIVEYSDFQCPACKAYKSILEDVYNQYSDKVVVVYRHFPLPKHSNSRVAAQAAQAAGLQGQEKFWAMHDLLFENQDTWSTQSRSDAEKTFEGYAEKIGLDMTKYGTDFGADSTAKTIADEFVSGAKAGINQTPSIFINGTLLANNPESIAAFSDIIANAQK